MCLSIVSWIDHLGCGPELYTSSAASYIDDEVIRASRAASYMIVLTEIIPAFWRRREASSVQNYLIKKYITVFYVRDIPGYQ